MLWNLVYALFGCRLTKCIPVFYKFKILDLIGIYIWKIEILSFWALRFWIAFTFKPVHSRSLQTFAAFWPKMAEHDVTRTTFSQKFLKLFLSETLVGEVKSLLDKVLKVLRQYLLLFLSYRENTGGGVIFPPSQRCAA